MRDIVTESDKKPDAFEASGTSPPAALAVHHKRSDYIAEGFKNRTHGEAKFNFRTYVGLGYFGSLAASLALTWALRDSKWIWPKYQKLTDAIANATKGNRTGQALLEHIERVDSNMTILSMFTGTTLMAVLPIKWREDHKAEIIKKYDREYYGDARVENDPAIQQAHALIDAAPKQTWKSVIGSRVVAFGATMGLAALIGSNESILGKSRGWSIDKMSIKAGRAIDRFVSGSNPEVSAYISRVAQHSPNDVARAAAPADRMATRLFNYLTLDGLYTVMTSSVLFVFTRLLAPIFDKNLSARENDLPATVRSDIGSKAVLPLPRDSTNMGQRPATESRNMHSTAAEATPDTRVVQASLAPSRAAEMNAATPALS